MRLPRPHAESSSASALVAAGAIDFSRLTWFWRLQLTHLASTWAMIGLIWFVQVVHYPLFSSVPADAFPAYEQAHRWRTTLVVLPLMLTEAVTTLALVCLGNAAERRLARWGAGLLLAIWVLTFFVQVPTHLRLEAGFDAATHAQLVSVNWVRTLLWTARGFVANALISVALTAAAVGHSGDRSNNTASDPRASVDR